MVHGDDWNLSKNGRKLKKDCLNALKKINSKLIEILTLKIFQAQVFKRNYLTII